MTDDPFQFKALSVAVDAGQLRLESSAADMCVQACDEYIAGLRNLLGKTTNMFRSEAFGTLRSAQQLAQKFVDLSNDSPGSIQDILKQHIDVASDMREVFFKAGAAYRAREDENQRAITAAGADG